MGTRAVGARLGAAATRPLSCQRRLVKLAWGNARRAARDFSVYFLTLVFAVCLLYSFLASSDYLLALSLTDAQRASFAKAGEVLVAFAVLIDVIFCFLLGYANAFLLRRRKRACGLGRWRVCCSPNAPWRAWPPLHAVSWQAWRPHLCLG